MTASLNKFAKETAWAVCAKAVALVCYYAMVYYMMQRMGVFRWGQWSAFWAVMNIVLLTSDQGINVAAKRFIAEARLMDDVPGVARATFLLRVVASVLFTVVFALVCAPLMHALERPDFVWLGMAALPLLLLFGIAEYFKALFEALHRLKYTFWMNAIEHGGKLVLVMVLYAWNPMFSAVVLAYSLATAALVLAGILVALRLIPGLFRSGMARPWLLPVWQYSFPIFLMSMGGFISLEIDTIMISRMRGDMETGIYSAAKQLVIFLPHISLAVGMGTLPALARRADDPEKQRKTYARIMRILLGIYVLIALGLALFAKFLLVPVLGSSYAASSAPLLALIPFTLFSSLSIFSGNLLNYRGQAWVRSLHMLVTIVLNIGLNWLWIPEYGAVGAAWASSIAYIPYFLLNGWQARRSLQ